MDCSGEQELEKNIFLSHKLVLARLNAAQPQSALLLLSDHCSTLLHFFAIRREKSRAARRRHESKVERVRGRGRGRERNIDRVAGRRQDMG